MKKGLLPLLIIAVGAGLMGILSQFKTPQPKRSHPLNHIQAVKARTVKFGRITPIIHGTGRVLSLDEIPITSEVTGRVLSDTFRAGYTFKQGDILVQMDAQQIETQLKSSISELLNSLADALPDLKNDIPEVYEKWNHFFQATTLTTLPALPTISHTREKLYLTRFKVLPLYFQAEINAIQREKYTLRAPFDGTVSHSEIHAGTLIRAGTTVGSIARTDILEVQVELPDKDVRWVVPQSSVRVILPPPDNRRPVTGIVDRITQTVDPHNQTRAIFVRITDPKTLLPGMVVETELTGKPIDRGVKIPREAIRNRKTIMVIDDGRLKETPVTIARFDLTTAYITDGIESGAVVVIEPLQDAIDGMPVTSEL